MKEKRRVWVLAIATLLCSFSLGAGVLAMAEENPVYSFDDFSSDCTKSGVTFSTFGQNASPRITQTSDIAVTQDTETHNQETTVEYNNPIFIGDNGVDTPFITYSIDPQGWGQRDMDAIIFTLYDENDPTQYVSVMQLFAAPNVANSSLFYAKGTGQVYQGYHSSGDVYSAGKLLGLNQGTISEAALYQDNESNSTKTVSQFINLYYDNETKAVYTDYYWADYDSRTIPNATNASGAKLVMIRDLDDEAYLNGDKAYAPDIKTAKLKITTVRGWYDYTDEFGEKNTSNIYSSQFYGGSADAHTLSDKGARYLLRAIDGTSLKFTGTNNAIESVGETKYFAASMESGRDVEIPALKGLNLFLGYSDGTEYTKTTYVKVTDSQNSSVTLTGLNEGKWTEGCGFTAGTEGVYTLYYYADSEMTEEIAKTQITVKNVTPDMDNLVYSSNPLDLFSSQTVGVSQGGGKVNNSANYSGVILSATDSHSSVKYEKEIDISDNVKTVPLVEFLPLPQEVGVGEVRTLVFKFYEKNSPENYFSVKFQHDSNIPGCDIMTAAANNQDYYGLKLIRNKDEYNNGLLAQKLDGRAAVSPYQPIGIYYDKSENCVYVSPTWDHVLQKSVGISKLRDFDDDLNLKLQGDNNTVTQPAWNGFSGNEIVMEVSFDTVVSGSTAKIVMLSVDGETFEKRLEGEAVAKGVVGYNYPIPEPIYYNAVAGDYKNFFESYSAVKVYDPTDAEVPVTDKNVFTPSTAGTYTIVYGVLEEGTSFGYNLTVEILSEADAGDIAFDFSQADVIDGMEVFLGERLSAVVTATSELYLKGDKDCGVTTKLYRNDSLVQTFNAGEAVAFTCDELGDYRIVYAATDYVGRNREKEVSFSVVRTSISFVDPDQKESVMDRTDETPVVSAADITVKDVYKNDGVDIMVGSESFCSFETNIEVSYNDGGFELYTNEYDFSALGKYVLQYSVSYQLEQGGATYEAKTQRTLTVVDNTAPVFGEESVITGIKKNEGKTDLGAVWYKAKTDSSITIGQENATDLRKDGSVGVQITAVVTDADGNTTDITKSFTDGTYTFTAEKAGVYYVKFTANDGSLSTSKTYVIEVKEHWLDVTVTETPEDAEYGVEYSLPQITATNYDGENITSSVVLKVEIVSGGVQSKEVQNYRWTPDVVGEVVIRYTVTMGNETVVLERTLKVKDNEAPVITLDGEPAETGSVGVTYVLPNIVITDNADPYISYRIYLVFNGTEKELYDPSFIPEDEGEYTIRIECEDFSGNPATKEIKVQVGERKEVTQTEPGSSGCGSSVAGDFWLILIPLGAFVVVMILKKKRGVK